MVRLSLWDFSMQAMCSAAKCYLSSIPTGDNSRNFDLTWLALRCIEDSLTAYLHGAYEVRTWYRDVCDSIAAQLFSPSRGHLASWIITLAKDTFSYIQLIVTSHEWLEAAYKGWEMLRHMMEWLNTEYDSGDKSRCHSPLLKRDLHPGHIWYSESWD